MVANNMAQLETMMLKEMQKAMTVVSAKVEADMYEEVGKFYTGKQPTTYQRTGRLANTPRTTALTTSGQTVSFEAYLDQSGGYTTGKCPSMTDVLNLTNYGTTSSSVGVLRPAVGRSGYWDRALKKMEKTFNRTMKTYFK